MAYTNERLRQLRVVDVYDASRGFHQSRWITLIILRLLVAIPIPLFVVIVAYGSIIGILILLCVSGLFLWLINALRIGRFVTLVTTGIFLAINKRSAWISWALYAIFGSYNNFAQNYAQAWTEELQTRGSIQHIYVFLDGNDSIRVPILYDQDSPGIGSDRLTIELLSMWYCVIRTKRMLTEVSLPRKLLRLDQVAVSTDL